MPLYYSPSTGGFYDSAIHPAHPADAVAVSPAAHAALLESQSAGQRIIPGPGGLPIAVPQPQATAGEMWERIKAERDSRTETGGFHAGGHWFHSDQKSRSQQLGLVLLGAAIPAGLQWKTMDGTFVPMTAALAQQILAAAASYDQAVFAVAEAHKAAMAALPDPSAYDFSGGWPPAYGD